MIIRATNAISKVLPRQWSGIYLMWGKLWFQKIKLSSNQYDRQSQKGPGHPSCARCSELIIQFTASRWFYVHLASPALIQLSAKKQMWKTLIIKSREKTLSPSIAVSLISGRFLVSFDRSDGTVRLIGLFFLRGAIDLRALEVDWRLPWLSERWSVSGSVGSSVGVWRAG